MTFTLTSQSFQDGDRLPEAQVGNVMGLQGGNRSPHLAWHGVPEGTRSFVVTAYDPDAPTGSGWWHWVLVNLPAEVNELAEGCGDGVQGLPTGAQLMRTDSGEKVYGGAAPGPGPAHRYVFSVHALKVDQLPVGPDASPALVGLMVHMNKLGSASITATYARG